MIMTELQKTRVKLLHSMNDYILQLKCKPVSEAWFIAGIPERPSEKDFELFATDDDEWFYICKLFGKLIINRGL